MRLLLVIFFSVTIFYGNGQNLQKVAQLQAKYNRAHSDSDRVCILGALAEHYYAYRLEKKADSILQQQLHIAEQSHNINLVLATLFGNAINNLPNWTSIETFNQTLSFVEQGLNYAREQERDDYVVLAYIRKAGLLRKRGQYDTALQQIAMAFPYLPNGKADSAKAAFYLETGAIYLAKGEIATAYKNLNNAFDIAYSIKNVPLQSDAYHQFSEVYIALGDEERAKENLFKSLGLNQQHQHKEGLLNDYIDLARITDNKAYIGKALLLADSLNNDRQRIFSKRLMFTYYMVREKNSKLALDYIAANDDLRQSYTNVSEANYNWWIGNVYRYSNRPDSAIYYYHKAEPEMERSYDVSKKLSVYSELGASYEMLERPATAIHYYERAFQLARGMENLAAATDLSLKLLRLYALLPDYKTSTAYTQQYLSFRDKQDKLLAERDILRLEVERENRRHQKDAEALAADALRKRNLQYMAITIAIAALFFLMMLLGMFPISRFTIKTLSYFAFICLFEFIVLLIDSFLHTLTHGEPLKIWFIKIFLIAMLVPLQHFMEHEVARFLASRKLMHLRNKISVKQWWQKKKPLVADANTLKEDAAVL